MRPVLIGINPNQTAGDEPLSPNNPSGRRLADLCGMDPDTFRDAFDRVNLHYHTLLPVARWDVSAARNLAPILRGRRVIALGRRVGDVLETPDSWMTWSLWNGGFVGATLPHPSGLNRWWNDPANVIAASNFLTKVTRPCVHVEGTDGSGKSTLISQLSELTGFPSTKCYNPPKSWEECLDRISKITAPGLLCDRSSGLISELVYGPVLRGRTLMDEDVMWRITRSLSHAVVYVYCRPPRTLLMPSFRNEEDPDHVAGVLDRQDDLVDRYDEVMARLSREGARVIWYDRSRTTVKEIAACIG